VSANFKVGSITGNLNVEAVMSTDVMLSYQWYKNTADNNSGGAAINGATAASYPLPADLTADVHYYYCVVSAADAVSVPSKTATVTVTENLSTGDKSVGGTTKPGTKLGIYDDESLLKITGLEGYVLVATVIADANGKYLFPNLPEGKYIIVATVEGYEPAVSEPIVIGSSTVSVTVNFTVNEGTGTVVPSKPSMVVTGVGEIGIVDVKIYPNPFPAAVHSTGAVETRLIASLRVTNAAGVVVHTQMISSPDETIRLGHLPAGMYFFTIEKDGQSKTIKAIKN
jgi:hypothetical protein